MNEKADGELTKFANSKLKHTRDHFTILLCVPFTVTSVWSLFPLKGCINFN